MKKSKYISLMLVASSFVCCQGNRGSQYADNEMYARDTTVSRHIQHGLPYYMFRPYTFYNSFDYKSGYYNASRYNSIGSGVVRNGFGSTSSRSTAS